MAISFWIDDSILMLKATDIYSLDDEAQIGEVAPKMLRENSLMKILIDFSDADTSITNKLKNTITGAQNFSTIFPLGTKFAIIPSKLTHNPEFQAFFEDMSFNRGVDVLITNDFGAAKEWLMQN